MIRPEPSHDGAQGTGEPSIIDAGDLAAELDVPPAVLTYLERKAPEARALVSGRRNVYRPADAALLAGLVELLYREGASLRDVVGALRTGEAEGIREAGARRLGIDLDAAVARPPQRTVPRDAAVGPKGLAHPPRRPKAVDATRAALLGELMTCVRLLEDAR